MKALKNIFPVYFVAFLAQIVNCVEFTFELSDNSEECFHEEVKKNTTCFLEYQVTNGGQLDVDVTLKDPQGKIIYEMQKYTFDSHTFIAEMTGIYTACFSNKFSSFSHKWVYLDFQVGDDPGLIGLDRITVLTQMETSYAAIHKSLSQIVDSQTHHRLRESQGRHRAEYLNERVLWWSLLETAAMLTIGFGQIIVLRNFFSDRKVNQSGQYRKL